MALTGAPLGLGFHFWYKFLDRRFPGRSTRIVLKKTAIDLGIGAFALNSAWFTSTNRYLKCFFLQNYISFNCVTPKT